MVYELEERRGWKKREDKRQEGLKEVQVLAVIVNTLMFSYSSVLLRLVMHHRVNRKGKHVELSLLPEDTGMPSVLPESLGLPQFGAEEEKREEDNEEKREEPKLKTKRRRGNDESHQVWV